MGKTISIISLVVVIVCLLFVLILRSSNNRSMNDNMNTALKTVDKPKNIPTDTAYDKIYGYFRKNVVARRIGNKYGLYDTISKISLTPLKYDNIGCFSEEGAIDFTQEKKYGFLNNRGVEIVPALYDFVFAFKHGFCEVKLNEKRGLIDKIGRLVIPVEYDGVKHFNLGLAAVKKDWKWGFVNKQAVVVIKFIYDDVIKGFDEKTKLAKVVLNGKQIFIDEKGVVSKK